MNIYLKIILYALIGGGAGYLCPRISERIVKYKCDKKQKDVPVWMWKHEEQGLCALLGAATFALSGLGFSMPASLMLCIFCIVAIVGGLVDFKIRIIPNELVLFIFALGFVFQLMEGGWSAVGMGLVSCIITFVMFMLAAKITYLFVKSMGVGAGDVKLASAIAFAVGFNRLDAFYFGIVVALIAYLLIGFSFKRIQVRSTFPMGVQIMAGFIAAFLLPAALPLL